MDENNEIEQLFKDLVEIENNILEEKSNYEMECRNLCYSPPVVTKMSKAK